jgi:hypothetical protein
MKSLHLRCLKRRRGGGGGTNEPPAAFLLALKGISTVRKYLMKFDFSDSMTAALSSTENEGYRFQQEAKKQQLTLLDMWKR